ncbi:MAG: MFS transporter, partial [Acidimicrobiia bacterium]|nr:MFS transporter [Acidimicrobiia bacterium]
MMTRAGTARSFLGDAAANPLLPVQALHSVGEGLFALSLVGSLFFNVSVDAARPRILLYLALTMAPFAILAPLIGPV